MAVTGGFAPGTYQAADLNRLKMLFGTAGLAKGMVVTQSSVVGMTVDVSVDGSSGDGVCYLPNGGWVRIDAKLTLSVPSNSTGSTRNDAVVAAMDPTGQSAASVAYVTNWAGGFAGGTTNQLVLALVAVPNNATQVVNANITNTSTTSTFGSAASAGNLTMGAQIQTSATSTYLVMNVNASGYLEWDITTQSGTVRGIVFVGTDATGVRHNGILVNNDGTVIFPGNASFSGGISGNHVADAGGSVFLKTNTVGIRIYQSNVTTGITFNKYDMLVLNTFA